MISKSQTRCGIDARLYVVGQDLQIAELTRILGLSPTKTWRAGDPIGKTIRRRREDGWEFLLPRRHTSDINTALNELLDAIEAPYDRIREAKDRLHLSIEVSCAIYFEGSKPALHFTPELLGRIVSLGADLDVDLYEV